MRRCLYELVHSLHPEVDLDLTVPPAERARFVKALHNDPCRVQQMLTTFDARDAQVTVDADRDLILQMIASTFGGIYEGDDDGIEYFNQETRLAIHDALAAFSWQLF